MNFWPNYITIEFLKKYWNWNEFRPFKKYEGKISKLEHCVSEYEKDLSEYYTMSRMHMFQIKRVHILP